MYHLTKDDLFGLAYLVTQELPFTEADIEMMEHIGQCEECYQKLRIAMALLEATEIESIAAVMTAPKKPSVRSTVAAVIRLAVKEASVLLEQVADEASSWLFDKPLYAAGVRGAADDSADPTLVDINDEETLISYDSETKQLLLHFHCVEDEGLPRVTLIGKDGARQLTLTRENDLLWAHVPIPAAGEYSIKIET